MTPRICAPLAFLVVQIFCGAGNAGDLTLPPGARPLAVRETPLMRYEVPSGPLADGQVPMTQVQAPVSRRTWRIGGTQTTLQVLVPLRDQILAQGFDIEFECADVGCGGFDFRFAIDVVPAPDMLVDIGNYQFLSARHADGSRLTLLVSRLGRATFVQLVAIGAKQVSTITPVDAETEPTGAVVTNLSGNGLTASGPPAAVDFATGLLASGHALLLGVDFQSGSTLLARDQYDSLDQLADFLRANPEIHVLLVGHTDTDGSLQGNINLSLARAKSVRRHMVDDLGIAEARIEAAGAGFMSPLAANTTAAGRELNRRVEVVALPAR